MNKFVLVEENKKRVSIIDFAVFFFYRFKKILERHVKHSIIIKISTRIIATMNFTKTSHPHVSSLTLPMKFSYLDATE